MTTQPLTSFSAPPGDRVRFHQIHRWFNPFAKQRAVMLTPLEPAEVDEVLRPHLFSWRLSRIPYNGLYGSIKSSGFILKRSMFGQPALTARYGSATDGTRLDLELSRSLRGVLGWGWDRVLTPLSATHLLICLFSEGVLGPPLWIDIDALWQPGNELPDQPGIWLLFTVILFGRFFHAITASYRQRSSLADYKHELAGILNAHEVGRSV